MKLRTNKIKTIIIFVSTLVFGVTALAISWRLQQEKQITEEEASAAVWTGNHFVCMIKHNDLTDAICDQIGNKELFAMGDSMEVEYCQVLQDDSDYNESGGWKINFLFQGPPGTGNCNADFDHINEKCFDTVRNWDYGTCAVCGKSWSPDTPPIPNSNESIMYVPVHDAPIEVGDVNVQNGTVIINKVYGINYWPRIDSDNYIAHVNSSKSVLDFKVQITDGDTVVAEKIVDGHDSKVVCYGQESLRNGDNTWNAHDSKPHHPRANNKVICTLSDLSFTGLQLASNHDYSIKAWVRITPDAVDHSTGGDKPKSLGWQTASNCQYILPTPFGNPEVDCISKTADPSEGVKVGDTVTYTVEYSSFDIEGNVTITDTLDPNLSFGEFTEPSSGCSESNGDISCTLPGNVSESIIYTATVESEGTISNTATVSSGELNDSEGCKADFTAIGPSAKCTSKTIAPTGEIDPGENVTFTINWENGQVAGKVLVHDEVPNGFENVTVTLPSSGCYVSGNTVDCSIKADKDASGSVTVTATAKADVRNLETENTAYVDYEAIDDGTAEVINGNSCTTGTEISEANAVCKEKTSSPEGPVNPGDIVTYQIDYTVERGPATVHITDTAPEYTSINTTADGCTPTDGCAADGDTLSCTINNAKTGEYDNSIKFCVQVDETGIPLEGTTITNNKVKVWEGANEPTDYDTTCVTSFDVEHEPPACIVTNPNVLTIRQQDVASTSVELTTRGDLGTHANLEFRWTATGGTLSSTEWHTASGTPSDPTTGEVGEVTDTVTWAPPADAVDTDTYDIKAYVRPLGSTDETGISADECEATSTITALDLICLDLIPNDPVGPFPFDMTFKADIGGDEGAAFTYDLDFGDESTHYTGNDTVAAGTTIELPYIPPQSSPHTYDSTTPVMYSPSLTVTNTETGEVSICPTVLAGTTQSSWSIVKDSDVDTCVVANSTVAYSIIVKNTGDYSADLEEVRDTIDPKIDTATITNIRECDANGLNCTTYNKADTLSGRTITWPGRTFTAGESRKYMYNVIVSTAGDYYNIAEAVPTTGEIVRDDETFPTCTGKSGPKTGVLSSAAYAMIFASILGAFGVYTYQTRTGAQVVANVIGKVRRTVWKKTNRKKSFERNSIRSSKKKA